jgi:hypothetical protein
MNDSSLQPEALVDAAGAAELLEVVPDRIPIMADEGLLTPTGDGPDLRFTVAEVLAARDLGG